MRRSQLLIASPSQSRAAAISQTVSIAVPNAVLPHRVKTVHFRNRTELVAELMGEVGLDTIALIDLTGCSPLENPWDLETAGELGLAANLVLSFPEVYFLFLDHGVAARQPLESYLAKPSQVGGEPQFTPEQDSDKRPDGERCWQVVERHHFVDVGRVLPELLTRLAWHHHGFRTLFDPTGLRSLLKLKLGKGNLGVGRAYAADFASRANTAASSVDDETSFLYLNAYVAYKAGFSAWLCSSAAETKRVHHLGRDGAQAAPCPLDVVIADFQLQFPDLARSEAWPRVDPDELALIERIEQLGRVNPGLAFYVVTADGITARAVFNKASHQYICDKPYEGVFSLLRLEDGADHSLHLLAERYRELRAARLQFRREGGEGCQSHPGCERAPAAVLGSGNRHGMPYAVGTVAERLLDRARSMLQEDDAPVERSVHAALLCLEAKELLSGLARTMYFEAVCRQHEAEVAAETVFFGIAANLHVANRLEELRHDLHIARGVATPTGLPTDVQAELAEWNCMLQTANNLRIRLHEREQFVAADECLREISRAESHMARLKLEGPTERSPSAWWPRWLRSAGLQRATGKLATAAASMAIFARKTPVLRVVFDAFLGIRRCGRVFAASDSEGSRAERFWKRLRYLAASYFNYVTDHGTSIGRLLEVNLVVVLVFWIVYVAFSGAVWSGTGDSLAASERILAAGLHATMLFVGGTGGMDGYLKHENSHLTPVYTLYLGCSTIEVTIAYVHLGLLVALLYRRITRAT